MKVIPNLMFDGRCEEAFRFYERCLGARVGLIFRYAGTPLAHQVPLEWGDKVMHGSITVGEQVLMGSDVSLDHYKRPRGFSLSLQMTDVKEAERVFSELSSGGSIDVPLEKTFWAARFGITTDRFGIPWQINCEE